MPTLPTVCIQLLHLPCCQFKGKEDSFLDNERAKAYTVACVHVDTLTSTTSHNASSLLGPGERQRPSPPSQGESTPTANRPVRRGLHVARGGVMLIMIMLMIMMMMLCPNSKVKNQTAVASLPPHNRKRCVCDMHTFAKLCTQPKTV